MTNNNLDNTTHSDVLTNKNAKLQKRLHQLKEEQKLTDQNFHHSFLNFIGYIAAGAALWTLMQWQFGLVFPSNADVPDDHLRFKDIWNVSMYVIPYCFWGMAVKNVSTLVITTLNICYSEFELYRLKRRLAK